MRRTHTVAEGTTHRWDMVQDLDNNRWIETFLSQPICFRSQCYCFTENFTLAMIFSFWNSVGKLLLSTFKSFQKPIQVNCTFGLNLLLLKPLLHMFQRNQDQNSLCSHILSNRFDVFRRHKQPMQWRHNRLQHHSRRRYTNIQRRPQQQQQHSMRRQNQRSFHSPRMRKPYNHRHPLLTTRGHHQPDMKWRHQVYVYFTINSSKISFQILLLTWCKVDVNFAVSKWIFKVILISITNQQKGNRYYFV